MSENVEEPEDGNHLRAYVQRVVANTTVLIEHDKVNALRFLTSSVREVVVLVDRLAPALEAAEAEVWAAIGPERGYGDGDVSAPELDRLRAELLTLADKIGDLVAARHARAG